MFGVFVFFRIVKELYARTADGAVVSWGESERTHNIVPLLRFQDRLVLG